MLKCPKMTGIVGCADALGVVSWGNFGVTSSTAVNDPWGCDVSLQPISLASQTFPAELDEIGRSDNSTSQTCQIYQTTLSWFQAGCGYLLPRPKVGLGVSCRRCATASPSDLSLPWLRSCLSLLHSHSLRQRTSQLVIFWMSSSSTNHRQALVVSQSTGYLGNRLYIMIVVP